VLAGYGIGARLEYIMVPIAFGFGAAIVPLVGRNIGAGQSARAERIAWIGAALVGTICASIGTLCALWPALWSGLYTSDAAAAAAAALYLQTVGPCYALLGFGLTFFMGCQGAGRLGWPLGGSVLRLCIAAGAGALVVASGQSNPQWLYLVVIASLLGYVGMMVAGTLRRPWAST
jgi:Na+-driven multidrug efflux pump